MAFMLVSLEQAKQVLRVDTAADDVMLKLLISAASRAVVRHLKGRASEWLAIDSPPNSPPDDPEGIPEDVTAAVIFLVGHFLRNPDNDVEKAFDGDELPAPVKAMLKPLRDPAVV